VDDLHWIGERRNGQLGQRGDRGFHNGVTRCDGPALEQPNGPAVRPHGCLGGAGFPDRVGSVAAQDVLARYIAAFGGTLRLVADFGDEQLNVA
jgi:hypothetical protein